MPGTVAKVPILGDGIGGEVSITTVSGEVTEVTATAGGQNYTRGVINFNLTGGDKNVTAVGDGKFCCNSTKSGHMADVYRELGHIELWFTLSMTRSRLCSWKYIL